VNRASSAPPYQECSLYKHILIPTDGSDLSEQAFNYGVALAKAVNAKVTGVTGSGPRYRAEDVGVSRGQDNYR
jgi:nucleotide-binding universal stress UspA family protein